MERDRSTSIPWWISWPGRLQPRDVRSPVSLADVGPTLLALLELPPTPDVDGVARDAELLGRPGPEERPLLLETGMWFVAEEAVASLDDSGRGLTYPSFLEGLLDVEQGDPPHIVVREDQREGVVRAKHRRLEWGDWALSYRPRTTGASRSTPRRGASARTGSCPRRTLPPLRRGRGARRSPHLREAEPPDRGAMPWGRPCTGADGEECRRVRGAP
jgi:hypothetical protein